MILKKLKIAAVIMAVAGMCFGGVFTSHAASPDYTVSSSTWSVAEGVTAHISNGVLYIDGNGAIPDYTNDTLSKRPWHTSIIGGVVVGKGITDIGERAFAEFPFLRHISVYSTTFIKDANAFHKIDNKPQLRIYGKDEAVRMIGDKIPYTSLNSWERLAQYKMYNIQYIVEDWPMVRKLRQSTYPDIEMVYPSFMYGLESHTDVYESQKDQMRPFVSPAKFAPGSAETGLAVTSKRMIPSIPFMETAAHYLTHVCPDYTYGAYFTNSVAKADKIYESFPVKKTYVVEVPADLRGGGGRSFKIIIAGNGFTGVLDDEDTAANTVSFSTNAGTFSYAIVYK